MKRVAVALAALCVGMPLDGQDKAGSAWDSKKSAWEQLGAGQKNAVFRFADDNMAYIKVSRSALTSTREVLRLARAAGFAEFTEPSQVEPGARLVVNGRDRAVAILELDDRASGGRRARREVHRPRSP